MQFSEPELCEYCHVVTPANSLQFSLLMLHLGEERSVYTQLR